MWIRTSYCISLIVLQMGDVLHMCVCVCSKCNSVIAGQGRHGTGGPQYAGSLYYRLFNVVTALDVCMVFELSHFICRRWPRSSG